MIRIRQSFLAIALVTIVALTPSVASADRPVDLGPDVVGFGDAANLGSTSSTVLASPIVGLATVPTGGGYWEAAADGGVFAFGAGGFFGSLGGQPLNAPIVGIATAPEGNGYWLAAADGGVFTFGTAAFRGSLGGQARYQRVVGIAATVTGNGYWLASSGTCAFSRGTSDQSIEMATTATSLLTDVTVAERACFDRVTFTFRLNTDTDRFGVDVGYRTKPFLNTAGNPVPVKGNAFLAVRLFPTSAVDQNADTFTVTYVGPPVVNTSKVVDVVKQEDFEAQMNWVIGLDRVRDFTVTQNAGVLTIDVG